MGIYDFLHDVYQWLFKGTPLDAKYVGVLIAIGIVFVLVAGVSMTAWKYRKALKKWKTAGGEIYEPHIQALRDGKLPQHNWEKRKRHTRNRHHERHPAVVETQEE